MLHGGFINLLCTRRHSALAPILQTLVLLTLIYEFVELYTRFKFCSYMKECWFVFSLNFNVHAFKLWTELKEHAYS